MAIDFKSLDDSPHLLDILVQMEDVLDSLDIYVFENWFDGEVVDGPKVRRYWFDFTLRYPSDKKPSETGAARMMEHGIRIDYNEVTKETEKGEEVDEPNFWEVKISIPKRLLHDMNSAELEWYDDEIDVDDIIDARDEGINDETGFMTDEGNVIEDEDEFGNEN